MSTQRGKTCLYPGRFQPFHNGHAEIVRALASRYDRLIIAIAQAHLSHTLKDPFTSGERYQIIRAFLAAAGLLESSDIIPVTKDIHDPVSFPFMRTIMPRFDVICVRNPVVKALAQYWGFEIDEGLPDRVVSGSRIRALMISGDEWKTLVPCEVAGEVDLLGGTDRMRQIALGEEY